MVALHHLHHPLCPLHVSPRHAELQEQVGLAVGVLVHLELQLLYQSAIVTGSLPGPEGVGACLPGSCPAVAAQIHLPESHLPGAVVTPLEAVVGHHPEAALEDVEECNETSLLLATKSLNILEVQVQEMQVHHVVVGNGFVYSGSSSSKHTVK